jgi:AcrR family transcriptional regulator
MINGFPTIKINQKILNMTPSTNITPFQPTFFLEKHFKDGFEKIAEEKQKRIMDAGIIEFAAKGFIAANINIIAKNAGISIGSMYNYFDSKESLFLTIADYGYGVLESVSFPAP